MNSLNICILTRVMPAHGRGGMEDHAMMLAKGIASQGHSVTVITTGHPEKDYEFDDGVKIYYLKKTIPRVYSKSWWIESAKKVLELHGVEKFDIIHSQSAAGHYFLIKKFNKKYTLPMVISLHGTPLDEILSRINIIKYGMSKTRLKDILFILYWLSQYFFVYLKSIPKADAVIATSNELERIIKRIFFVKKKKLCTVFNGMDLSLFSPGMDTKALREKLPVNDKTKILLCVARFVHDKGIDNVIRALPIILKSYQEIKLVLVGDGELRDDLIELTQLLGLKDYVHFQGFVEYDELPKYFNLCDVFVNATIRRNGYDLTMLEAMACKKVVVSSDIGSTPTLISNNIDGILVPVGDEKALAEKIVFILNNPRLANEIEEKARLKAIKAFSLEKMVGDTINVYLSVLEKNTL